MALTQIDWREQLRTFTPAASFVKEALVETVELELFLRWRCHKCDEWNFCERAVGGGLPARVMCDHCEVTFKTKPVDSPCGPSS